MAEFTKTLFLRALDEWGHYADAFGRLPAADRADFLKQQGYASLRELMTHVAAWWEEGRRVVQEAIEHPDRPGRKYDLDQFNAVALARFKDMPEPKLMAWYEAERQKLIAQVTALTDEQMKLRRVISWLDGVILEHLKEHAPDAPRFLVVDMLQREWSGAVARFNALSDEQQASFLKKQGFARLRDLVAHIVAWWEQGICVIERSSETDPCAVPDTDAFNAQAVERFGKLPEAEVFAAYEKTRLTLASLVDALPDEVLSRTNVQTWLRADVLEHYFEHAA